MGKIRFGTYIPTKMKESLDLLSERSKIKIAPLVEEAIGDLLNKPHYKELLKDEKEVITNVSMQKGWLCLSNKTNKVFLKTFRFNNGRVGTITIDNFSENPITIQNYVLENKLNLNSWENIFSETIDEFKDFETGLKKIKDLLNEDNFHNVKIIVDQEQK